MVRKAAHKEHEYCNPDVSSPNLLRALIGRCRTRLHVLYFGGLFSIVQQRSIFVMAVAEEDAAFRDLYLDGKFMAAVWTNIMLSFFTEDYIFIIAFWAGYVLLFHL